jgi:hypothetical protein
MIKLSFSKAILIGAACAIAISLSGAGAIAAGEKKAAAKPAGPGLCTGHVSALKWGHLSYRSSTGAVVPTLMWCPEASCPAKC